MCFCFSLFFLCTVLMCTAGAAIVFVCFKILWFLFCLFCNFYVFLCAVIVCSGTGCVFLKTLSLLFCLFCNFYGFFVCSGSVQRRERPSCDWKYGVAGHSQD